MKRLLLFAFLAIFSSAQAFAQICMADSSILVSGDFIAPPLYTDTTPVIATKPACIGQPYSQSVTINIPDTASVPFGGQAFDLAINNVSVPTTGAISNLPAGLTYVCNPPNCVFQKNTLGCILIYGTPTGTLTMPDTADLAIAANISSSSFPIAIPISLPADIAPGAHFYIVTHPSGMCIQSTNQIPDAIGSISNAPNPFDHSTTITVEAITSGAFRFEVFDLFGKKVYADEMQLISGRNQFTFDAGDLSNGMYFYSIGNQQGRVTKSLVVAR